MHRPSLVSLFLILAAAGVYGETESLRPAGGMGRSRVVRIPQPAITDSGLWLRTFAIPLQGTDPGLSTADLTALRSHLRDARIIALGDASHGTREFYRMKHRLIDSLVSHHDVTMIAFEGPWPQFNQINAWIQGGDGDPAALLYDEVHWFWNTREVLDLLWWLRNYNLNRGERPAVQVAGVDPYTADPLIKDVISFLRVVDPPAVAPANDAYSCLRIRTSATASGSVTSADHPCVQAAGRVVAMLTTQKDRYVAHSSAWRFEQVLQSARMARQSAEIRFALPYLWQETRDRVMAENLSWLHEDAAEDPRKLIFWGHNLHVSRVPYILSAESRPNRSVGTVLSERYGEAYYVMATATLTGRWMGITSQSAQTFATAEIPDLPENSYERLFEGAGQPVLFIPFRGMDVPPSIATARPMLIMFASPVYEIFTLPIAAMYDSVLFIRDSSETTLLH